MSSEKARTRWRDLLDMASKGNIDIVIERHGKATAAVISYEDYQAIRAILSRLRAGTLVQQGEQLASILEQIALLPDRKPIADPVVWQIQQREERQLPGRER
jgi:prevent-host-death family protein